MKKIIILLVLILGINFNLTARGIYGIEHIFNKTTHDFEDNGVRVSKDTNLMDLGDVIDFEIRGKGKGKLEIFSIQVDNKNGLYIKGYDLTHKINREFKFPNQ